MFPNVMKILNLFNQIILNLTNRSLKNFRRSHKHICGVNIQLLILPFDFVIRRIKDFYFLYFISKEMNAKTIICISGENIYGVAFNTEVSMIKFHLRSSIETLHQLVKQFSPGNYLTLMNTDDILLKFYRVSYSV